MSVFLEPRLLCSQSPAHHQQDVLRSLKRRLQTAVPEFPRHRLRMLARLGEGAFGTVSLQLEALSMPLLLLLFFVVVVAAAVKLPLF